MAAAAVRDVPEGNTIEAVTRRLAEELLTYRGSMDPIPAGITIETIQNATRALARLAVTRIHAMLDEKIAALNGSSAEFYNRISTYATDGVLLIPAPENIASWEASWGSLSKEIYATNVYRMLTTIGRIPITETPADVQQIDISPVRVKYLLNRLVESPLPETAEEKQAFYSAIRKMHLVRIYNMYRAARQQGGGRRTTRRRSRRSSHVTFSDQL
jgi:hypothetical protein